MIYYDEIKQYIDNDPFINNVWSSYNKRPKISIRPTNGCNLGCTYCYQGLNKDFDDINDNNIEIMKEEINKFFISYNKKYPEMKHNTIVNIIGGEISIYNGLDKIVDCVKEIASLYNQKITFSFTSNGFYLSQTFKDFLNKYRNETENKITISLDPKKTHDNGRIDLRGNGTYGIIWNNIKYLHNEMMYKVYRNIMITTEVMNKYNSFQELIDELEEDNITVTKRLILTYDFVHGKEHMTEKEKKFISDMNTFIVKSTIDCVLNGKKLKYVDRFLSFDLLVYFKILYSIDGYKHSYCMAGDNFLVIIPSKNGVEVGYCENMSKQLVKQKSILSRAYNSNPSIINTFVQSSDCEYCEFKCTCMQYCPLYNIKENCSYNKLFIAKDIKNKFRQALIETPNFYDKLIEYIKQDKSQGDDAWISYVNNREFWIRCINETFDVELV